MPKTKTKTKPSSKRGTLDTSKYLIFVGVLVIIIACALAIYRNHQHDLSMRPTVLIVTRYSPFQSDVKPFTIDVKSPQAADAILSDIHKLQAFPTGGTSCPEDDGVSYSMTFVSTGLIVTADPTGCQIVSLSSPKSGYRADSSFWKDLSKATGKSIDPHSGIKYY